VVVCGATRSKPSHPAHPDAESLPDPAADAMVVAPPANDKTTATRGAAAELELLAAMPTEILEHVARGGKPDEQGAIGHNREGWMGAQYQRSAALHFLVAVSRNDRTKAEDAWRAFDLAFAQQQNDG